MATTVQRRPSATTPYVPTLAGDVDRLLTQSFPFMQAPFGRLFTPLFRFTPFTKDSGWLPAAEMTETKDKYLITAEMPGLKKEDIKVDFADGMLTIAGEKREEKVQEDSRYYACERTYGAFERIFAFPGPVDADKITATVTDGVLKIQVPKSGAQNVETKHIAITQTK